MKFVSKRYQIKALLIGLFLSSWGVGSQIQASELSPARRVEVTILTGAQLPQMLNQPFSKYSVMTVQDGALAPIPFQFDDVNVHGFLYAPGGVLEIEGRPDLFEEKDQLAFMLKDSGSQASEEMKAALEGQIVSEIQLAVPAQARYAYIVEGNPLRSDKHYTFYDRETGLISTNEFSLQVDPHNLLLWEDLKVASFTEDRNLLDTMKIRIIAKLAFVKAKLSNKLIPNEVVAVKNGPVRSIIEMDADISILGINLVGAGASVTVTESTVQFPVFATIPSAAAVLSDLTIEISLDFNQLEGTKIRTALGPKEPVIAGGGGADPGSLDLDIDHAWIAGTHDKGAGVIALFKKDKDFRPTLKPLFRDATLGHKPDKPERYQGSHPQVGYIASDIPSGVSIVIGIDLYLAPDFWSYGLEKSIDEIMAKTAVTLL